MQKQCGQCGKKFKASRIDASWCSARCRVAHHRRMRNAGVTDARCLNFDDIIRRWEAGLAAVTEMHRAPTCAGWSAEDEAAFARICTLFKHDLAGFKASRDSVAKGGEPIVQAECAVPPIRNNPVTASAGEIHEATRGFVAMIKKAAAQGDKADWRASHKQRTVAFQHFKLPLSQSTLPTLMQLSPDQIIELIRTI